ncbi:hypothetical protein L3X38_040649 [Prunus dulcis]|uniref:Uncharacterized protein n=1 Tax=Prunus dulcis TaxID=3755 RepID=A0AAD4VBN4_PRUDU|nr:hypothetical protein L3X38_040649 [Prunus dulcis]
MVEDVLVHIDKFYFLVDFIVLDTEPVVHSDSQILVILGTIIWNMTLEPNIWKQSANNEDVDKEVYMIEIIVQNFFNSSFSFDPLQFCSVNRDCNFAQDFEIQYLCSLLDFVQVQEHNGWIPKYEELPTVSDEKKSSREKDPKCELKPLPAGLKYAFLGEDETYPVVISSKLQLLHEGMLLKVLKDHRTAIG